MGHEGPTDLRVVQDQQVQLVTRAQGVQWEGQDSRDTKESMDQKEQLALREILGRQESLEML